MKLIVCLDKNNGMCFNQRRQSRDRVVCEKIREYAAKGSLWMDPYSKRLFDDSSANMFFDARYLEKAGRGEYCFAEITQLKHIVSNAEEIIIFRWDRKYPADVYFPNDILRKDFRLFQMKTFQGYSHAEITQEVYIRA